MSASKISHDPPDARIGASQARREAAGRFVTFEGGEGAGKSTQIRLLAEKLEALGHDVVLTREPGGSPLAERLREIILSGRARALGSTGEALLFAAARIDHIDTFIKPALARGAIVLCDRFADSTRAYQGLAGELDTGFINALEEATLAGLRPDLTFILDLPAATGLERARKRRGEGAADRFEREGPEFHEKLRAGFLQIARDNDKRCVVIAADRREDEVAQTIWSVAAARLWPDKAQAKIA